MLQTFGTQTTLKGKLGTQRDSKGTRRTLEGYLGARALKTLGHLGGQALEALGYSKSTWALRHSKGTWALEAIEALYLAHSVSSNLCCPFIFCNLFYGHLGEWNNNKIWKMKKILANIAQDNVQQLLYRYMLAEIKYGKSLLTFSLQWPSTIKWNTNVGQRNRKKNCKYMPYLILHSIHLFCIWWFF